ncbi:hydroxymyristoyl-ACP dehydratase [Legionella sp. CNM-4043-24]|uniref:hydroxymyristoyl-ACP dehydratase n=1 Tax=Legionella sp. CNM-4043-24 TaxID=3421646 RepID=UPI00403ABDAD
MRFLFVDRILQLEPGERVRGLKHVTLDDPFLYPDEQGRLVFAPSLIGESLGQLAAWNVMAVNDFSQRPVAGVVASASLHRPVYAGDTLLLESFIDNLDDSAVQYHSVARVGEDVVFTVDGALGPLLPMSQFISDDEVRRQFAEINRPGDWEQACQLVANQSIPKWNETRVLVPMQFDRILESEPGVSLVAEKRVTRSAPWFPDHFPYNPVLPMTVLLECKMNLARVFLARSSFAGTYEVSELRKMKMNVFVHPGDVIRTYLTLHRQDEQELILRYRSEVEGKRVCVLDVVMTAKGR